MPIETALLLSETGTEDSWGYKWRQIQKTLKENDGMTGRARELVFIGDTPHVTLTHNNNTWHRMNTCPVFLGSVWVYAFLSFSLHSSLPFLPPSFFLSHGIIINNGLFHSQYVLVWIICYTAMFHILFLLDSSKEFSGLHMKRLKIWGMEPPKGMEPKSGRAWIWPPIYTVPKPLNFLLCHNFPAPNGLQRAGRGEVD